MNSSELTKSLWREVRRWLRENSAAAIRSAIYGAIFAYIANFVLLRLVFPYSNFDGTGGTASSLLTSSLFFGIVTTVLFGAIGYYRAVGSARFWHDLASVPGIIIGLFRADGAAARAHLLWGAATSFIAMEIVTPLVGLAIAIGFLSTIPSIIGRVISNFLLRVWSSAADLVAPARKVEVDATTGMLVGMIGSAAALALGLYIDNPLLKLGLAVATGGLAFALGRGAPATQIGAAIFVATVVGQFLLDLLHPVLALAQDRPIPGEMGHLLSGSDRPIPGEMTNPLDASFAPAEEHRTIVQTASESVPPAVAGSLFAAPGFALGAILAQLPSSITSLLAEASTTPAPNAPRAKPTTPMPKSKLPERPVRGSKPESEEGKKEKKDGEKQTEAMEKAYEDLERVGEKMERAHQSAEDLVGKNRASFDLPERAVRVAAVVLGMRAREWLRELAPDRGTHALIPIDQARAIAAELRGLRDFGVLPDDRLATLASNLKFKGPGETLWTIDLDTLGFKYLKDGAWVSAEPPQFLDAIPVPRGHA